MHFIVLILLTLEVILHFNKFSNDAQGIVETILSKHMNNNPSRFRDDSNSQVKKGISTMIWFPGSPSRWFSQTTTPPPRPSPSSSIGECQSRSASCIFLGACPQILDLVRIDNFAIRRYYCGSGPEGHYVCCPNHDAQPVTATRRPKTFRTPRPPGQNRTISIFFPGFGSPRTSTRSPKTRRPPGGASGSGSLLPEPPQCGMPSKMDRIFGGSVPPIGAYPWVAALGFSTPGSSIVTFGCAGAVINSRYVVTAGHCLDPNELRGAQLTVLHLGDWDLTTPTDCQVARGPRPNCFGPHVVAGFEDTIIHPQYNTRGRNSDDIALIRLDITIDFNSLNTAPIAPVCLPTQGLNTEAFANGRPSIAVGWGFTEHGNYSNVLLRVSLPFANQDICVTRYGSGFAGKQLCMGGREGFDTCSGDSGGPLVLSGPRGPPYFLIGIVSFGPYRCALADTPAVYTEVSQYRNWIERNLRP